MLSPRANHILDAIQKTLQERAPKPGPHLHVSEAISTAAFVYERLRNLVDFRAEHLVRKTAILRILSRRVKYLGQREGLAESLVRELIRARHLPNNAIPESKVMEVQQILEKYLAAIDIVNAGRIVFDVRAEWLLGMCSVELEELFSPPYIEHALVQSFYESIKDHIASPSVDNATREFQLYIAAYRTLRKSDAHMAEYHLLRIYLPSWFSDTVTVSDAAVGELMRTRDSILEQLTHPIGKRFMAQARKVVAPFIIIEHLIQQNGAGLSGMLANKDAFRTDVTKLIEERYAFMSDRLWRRGVRALVYIFITKMLVGMLIELPYDLFVVKALHWLPLLVNILFPPVLLFTIVLSLKKPDVANTKVLVQAIFEVMYGETDPVVFAGVKRIQMRKRRGFLFYVFTFLYLALFGVSFGGIILLLQRFQFNAVSMFLFLFFTSVVSFFGVSLRQSARELIIVSGKERLGTVIFNALTLPILTAGRYLSENINRINVFLFLMDVLIEAPFQALMELLESWFDFLREKKEEI